MFSFFKQNFLFLKVINERNNNNNSKINYDNKIHKKSEKSLMDLLMEMMTQGRLSNEEIREQTDTFLFAGIYFFNYKN